MDALSLAELLEQQRAAGRPYHEFLRSASMSVGLYVLAPGDVDRQSPHAEDEIYVVMAGAGSFTAGQKTRAVGAGDVLYVPATVPHRFHDIIDELRLVVVFAPPET